MAAQPSPDLKWCNFFFLYDGSKVKGEGDLTRAGICYFYPPQTLLDYQEVLCSQIAGVIQCVSDLSGSPPRLIKLRKMKFAIQLDGTFLWVLGCAVELPDISCTRFLKQLMGLFRFYHGTLQRTYQVSSPEELSSSWERYVEHIQSNTNDLQHVFGALRTVDRNKVEPLLLLKAALILQACQRCPLVTAGCILYKGRVVSSQLPPDIAARILVPSTANCSKVTEDDVRTEESEFVGVSTLPVFLTSIETIELEQHPVNHWNRTSPSLLQRSGMGRLRLSRTLSDTAASDDSIRQGDQLPRAQSLFESNLVASSAGLTFLEQVESSTEMDYLTFSSSSPSTPHKSNEFKAGMSVDHIMPTQDDEESTWPPSLGLETDRASESEGRKFDSPKEICDVSTENMENNTFLKGPQVTVKPGWDYQKQSINPNHFHDSKDNDSTLDTIMKMHAGDLEEKKLTESDIMEDELPEKVCNKHSGAKEHSQETESCKADSKLLDLGDTGPTVANVLELVEKQPNCSAETRVDNIILVSKNLIAEEDGEYREEEQDSTGCIWTTAEGESYDSHDNLVEMRLYLHCVKELTLCLLVRCEFIEDREAMEKVYHSSLASLNGLEVHLREMTSGEQPHAKGSYTFAHYDCIQDTLTTNLSLAGATRLQHTFVRAAALLHSDFTCNTSLHETIVRNASTAVYGIQNATQETFFQQLMAPQKNSGIPNPQDSAFSLPGKAKQKLLKHGVNLL
ncbi:Hermansky-Pudlak syndrome 4 protein isoform X1 [Erpetoichthys calabaricus]|uniref:HPS4 biosis of lysosomal organelles complex 3 subunit 2 n=2 Tax=Erpetoichthys calabaricus TaxID=27687 RepID=A0A8C4TA82_ERPCA|nr:Hermansky-Pudlak syndrome 4 protein isoform X1 [Erpetoichthys calabaricus]